jgi:hypothetical protein
MPKSKRAPIAYTQQFGAGIFRPKDVVESDLAEGPQDTEAPPSAPAARTARPQAKERTIVETTERTKIRHTFDIFQDQLLALTEIQAGRFKQTGRKPRVGDLVQEALDAYIERTNDRSGPQRRNTRRG